MCVSVCLSVSVSVSVFVSVSVSVSVRVRACALSAIHRNTQMQSIISLEAAPFHGASSNNPLISGGLLDPLDHIA